jgi:hypothetical protein
MTRTARPQDLDQALLDFVDQVLQDGDASDERERAVALYYAVRDGFQYDPFDIRIDAENLHPADLLSKGRGHCIDKAVFLNACLNTIGIRARLGLARVRNHVGTARLEQALGTDVLVPHGYSDVCLDGQWIKCTPAFNRELCDKLGVHPLEWDGRADSIFQEDDRDGGRFMEYLDDYGSFDRVPVDFIVALLKKEYPHQFDANGQLRPLAVEGKR